MRTLAAGSVMTAVVNCLIVLNLGTDSGEADVASPSKAETI